MRLTIRVLGLELIDLNITTDEEAAESTDPGDCTTNVIGFAPSPGDQRWEQGSDY